MIEMSGVTKSFGTNLVLKNIDMRINPGEFVSIVGPSGCGKSTILRILTGLESYSGKMCLDGEMGYIFQEPTLMPWLNVKKNIMDLCDLKNRTISVERLSEIISEVNLTGHECLHPHELSGGMKMRCSIARSLLLEPEVFLFDEPFGALDEITRHRLNETLANIFVEKQFAGLFITHSIEEAVFLSTTVHVMSRNPGQIIESVDIPFDFPRDSSLRFDPQFVEISRELSTTLEGTHI